MLPNLYKKTSKDAVWEGTTKTAGSEVVLSDKTDNWPKEIIQDVYKQLPYVADFSVDISMDRVDAERGYALGHISISNITSMAPEQAQGNSTISTVRVPVIVRDKKLQPFDVFITRDSKVKPLTESRLREALFRPETFDRTDETPGPTSLIGQLYPPYRQNFGFGGRGQVGDMGDTMKVSSKKLAASGVPNSSVGNRNLTKVLRQIMKIKTASVLADITPTITSGHLKSFWETLETPWVKTAVLHNEQVLSPFLRKLASIEPVSPDTISRDTYNMPVKPDVIQVQKLASGYLLKSANHNYWRPISCTVQRGSVVRSFGEKVAVDVDSNGSTTIVEGNGASLPQEDDKPAEIVDKFGMYSVKDTDGNDIIGMAFPSLIDFNTGELSLMLFTNGEKTAVQSEIYGVYSGRPEDLPSSDMEVGDTGILYYYEIDGDVKATVPITVKGTVSSEDGPSVFVELWGGDKRFLVFSERVKEITQISDDTFLVPDAAMWMSLVSTDNFDIPPPSFLDKKAAVRQLLTLTLRADDDGSVSISGYPLDKLGHSNVHISMDDAMFLMGGFGVNLPDAMMKIGQSLVENKPVSVGVSRLIKLATQAASEARERTVTKLASFPNMRVELWKEAAFIPDPTAVDTLLSIGFINPENIATFVSYLPNLEEAQEKLCELLIATRLGLKDIPLEALERAVKSLEKTIEGLKLIAFQSLD